MTTLAQLAEKMMKEKIDVPTISRILGVELEDLYELRDNLGIQIEQDDVVEAMSRLGYRAFEKGMEILETGNPSSRMALIRIMLSMMRGRMSSQSPREQAALIESFRDTIELHEDSDDDVVEDEEIMEDVGPSLSTGT